MKSYSASCIEVIHTTVFMEIPSFSVSILFSSSFPSRLVYPIDLLALSPRRFFYLSYYLPNCPPIHFVTPYLFINLTACLSISFYGIINISMYPFIHLSTFLFIYLCRVSCMCVCVCTCPCVCPSLHYHQTRELSRVPA